jgi:thermosome
MSQIIPATTSSGQQVLVLKEGSSESKGRDAQRNNIFAAKLISEIVKTSLGPRGMDKMLVDTLGDVTITNDGATMLKEIDVQHPAAKMIVEISKTTDNEVGDGTTSAVVLCGSLLESAEELVRENVHPTIIVDGYRKAANKALKALQEFSIKIPADDRTWLMKIAKTSMASKLISRDSDMLSQLAVDAVLSVAEKVGESYKVDIEDVKVEKKPGAGINQTELIKGIVLDKEVVHAGMPKRIANAKIALINSPLEIEKTEFDAKINISDPSQIKRFLDEENSMLKAMVEKISKTGGNVAICQKGIDDTAQHYLAKNNILAVRRVKESDMTKLAKATGGRIVTNLDDLTENDLGKAELVEERNVEEDKWVFVEGCKNPKSTTILVRGATQRVTDEAERSIHDALMVVKDAMEHPSIVVGGGATEAELSHELREFANKLTGREQLAVQKYADALESIPLTLAVNSGMDPIDTQVELRAKHGQGGGEKKNKWYGVNCLQGKCGDMEREEVYEPASVKEQIIKSATEAASMILRIDDVIASGKMKSPPTPPRGGGEGGMGGGAGMED